MSAAFLVLLLLAGGVNGTHQGSFDDDESLSSASASSAESPRNIVTISGGASITPYRNALTTYSGQVLTDLGQSSRPGPAASVQFTHWFGNNAIFAEANYQNSSMRLHPFDMAWTMHRVSADFGYQRRFPLNARLVPFVKVGIGPMVYISAEASQNGGSAGLNYRSEGLASVGVEAKLSRHFNVNAEYECRFVRNNDTSDQDWNARNNVISEPKIGVSFHF